jgi:hypothetical protein
MATNNHTADDSREEPVDITPYDNCADFNTTFVENLARVQERCQDELTDVKRHIELVAPWYDDERDPGVYVTFVKPSDAPESADLQKGFDAVIDAAQESRRIAEPIEMPYRDYDQYDDNRCQQFVPYRNNWEDYE